MKTARILGLALALALPGSALSQSAPNPILLVRGAEYYAVDGRNFVRYRYEVANLQAYPDALFQASPALPPCGSNANASRTWIDFFDQRGKRLYGFCALGKPADLAELWFPLEEGVVPPSWVYIEMTDRQANVKYKSNLAETTL
jgi:hypothetical protein